MFTILFLGLPVLGLGLFALLYRRMVADRVASPPVVALFSVFAAYGALLLFGISEVAGVWSGMHSLAFVVLGLAGLPWFLLQGRRLWRTRAVTGYHRAAALLSLGFPLVLGALLILALAHEA